MRTGRRHEDRGMCSIRQTNPVETLNAISLGSSKHTNRRTDGLKSAENDVNRHTRHPGSDNAGIQLLNLCTTLLPNTAFRYCNQVDGLSNRTKRALDLLQERLYNRLSVLGLLVLLFLL